MKVFLDLDLGDKTVAAKSAADFQLTESLYEAVGAQVTSERNTGHLLPFTCKVAHWNTYLCFILPRSSDFLVHWKTLTRSRKLCCAMHSTQTPNGSARCAQK